MANDTLDIELYRNGDWGRGFTITDEADPPAPIDLTGATFDLDIRFFRGTTGSPVIDIPIVCEEPETGYFEFWLSGDDFKDIGNKSTNTRLVYDIVVTQDGRKMPVLSGTILLRPGVSDNETE